MPAAPLRVLWADRGIPHRVDGRLNRKDMPTSTTRPLRIGFVAVPTWGLRPYTLHGIA